MEENKNVGQEHPVTSDRNIQLKQLEVMEKQLFFSRLGCIVGIVLVIVVSISLVTVIPRLNSVLINLEQISADLNSDEMGELVTNVNDLTKSSQESVETVNEKLEEVDLDALNRAIDELATVIKPLADLLGGGN